MYSSKFVKVWVLPDKVRVQRLLKCLCRSQRMSSGRYVIPSIITLCTLSPWHEPTTDKRQEMTGTSDKMRHTTLVGKDRRCDPTFAYQQIMFDVSRKIQHYTSRCVVFRNFCFYLCEHVLTLVLYISCLQDSVAAFTNSLRSLWDGCGTRQDNFITPCGRASAHGCYGTSCATCRGPS